VDVLITGAGGRIGSQLARVLVDEGHSVRGLGLPGDRRLILLEEELGVVAHFGDLADPDALVAAVSGVDAVCHLAAALTTHDVADDLFIDVNLRGTYNLLVAARDHAPKISRFVYASSDAVYWPALDRRPQYLPIDESHPLTAGSVYGASKIGAEALCRAFALSYGIPFVVMRPTATASPAELIDPASPFGRRWFLDAATRWLETHPRTAADDDLLARMQRLDASAARLVLVTDPSGVASLTMLTDARDVARAMRLMIDQPEAIGEAFNVGPAAPHSARELVTKLSDALGLEVTELPHPSVRPSWYVSSAKARAVLGYVPQWSVFEMVDEAVAEAGR